MPKISEADILARASEVHDGRFTYGPFFKDPKNKRNMMTVICPVHGQFTTGVSVHLGGSGCKRCSATGLRRTLESVIEDTKKYNFKYRYLELKPPKAPGKVATVVYECPEHGVIEQNMNNHLKGQGCRFCGSSRLRLTQEEAFARCVATHGDTYEYVAYTPGSVHSTKMATVTAVCKDHGQFTQMYSVHISGGGCPKCKHAATSVRQTRTEESILELAAKKRTAKPVRVLREPGELPKLVSLCDTHGEFTQGLASALHKNSGCPLCMGEKIAALKTKPDSFYMEKVLTTTGLTVTEVIRDLTGGTRVRITCDAHGPYETHYHSLLNGVGGCLQCNSSLPTSKAGNSVLAYMQSLNPEVQAEARLGSASGSSLRWDATCHRSKIAVELHGIYWHADDKKPRYYHQRKHNVALSAGYRTIHVFDDEWSGKQEIVKRVLRNAMGLSDDRKIDGRKCKIVAVTSNIAREFLNKNHIQGYTGAGDYFGLTFDGELVAVAAFAMRERGRSGKRSTTHCELARYATSASVRGGMSKLLSHAQRILGFKVCTTFSDIRFFSGGSYAATGFSEVGRLPPDYFYCAKGKRIHKCNLQKSRIRSRALAGNGVYEEGKTEAELAALNGYSRVWDCGKIIWQRRWE